MPEFLFFFSTIADFFLVDIERTSNQMKRLLEEADKIEQTEVLVAYLERKLAKQKQELERLRQCEKRGVVLANLFNCYISEQQRQPMLLFKDSQKYENLLDDLRKCEEVVGHRDCLLTYASKVDVGGEIWVKFVGLKQDGELVEWGGGLHSHMVKRLKQLERARIKENEEREPNVPEERTVGVVLVQALTEKEAAKYWKGPHDCLVSIAVERVPDEAHGELSGWYVRQGDSQTWERNEETDRKDLPEYCLSRDEWLAKYAHYSPKEGLWFSNETWALRAPYID